MNFGKYARNKKIKQINSKSSKIKNLVSSTFFKLLVFFILVAGIIAFSAGLGTFKAIIDASPSIDHLLEKIQPEGYTTIIYDLQGNEVQKLHGADANRIYVEYDQIPSFLGEAFIAIEDERFWRHNGVDLQGFMRAIFTNIRTRSFSEGASTITQQIIKNNVLTTDVTIERKLQEMYLAVELEKHLSKEDILELYMNTVASGRGTNGVQTASQLYFNKDVWDISIAEAAVLASITNKPTRFDPVSNPENNRDRAERVLNKLLEQEYITQAEYDEAYNTDVYSQIQINSQIREENASSYSYFVDEAIDRLVDDLTIQKGYSEAQAYNLVYRGGLSIYITQDAKIQEGVDTVFNNEESYPPEYEDYAMKLLYSLSILKDEEAEHFYHEEQFANREEAEAYIQTVWDEYGLTQSDFDNGLAESLWVLILFKKFYAKISKRLSEEFTKHNINTNYIKTFLTFILLLSLLSFVWYEYIKDSELITSTLYRIFTIYLLLYLIIKIVIFSYKITFWIAESNLIDVQYLKKWDIIDKQYLIKMLWKQDSLWASWKDTNKEWLFFPDPIEYIKSMNTVLEAEEVDIIKKAYEKVNSSISLENKEVEVHKIKIMNTFAFSPYIFMWFIFTFIVEDKLIKYIVEFSVNTIKGVIN